jgi:hypothetical protein
MKMLLIALLVTGLFGCATASKMNRLSIGMTKAQVIAEMGDPDSVSASAKAEVLKYSLINKNGFREDYGVGIKEGKVERYGSMDEIFPPTPEELKARDARAQAAMQMYQMQQQRAPSNTNCTTTGFGNMASTNCHSY